MTRVRYEPALPALEMVGHAGAGLRGQDPICAALSMLLFTLAEAEDGAQLRLSDGYARITGGERADYALIVRGVRLLARNYPAFVSFEERS